MFAPWAMVGTPFNLLQLKVLPLHNIYIIDAYGRQPVITNYKHQFILHFAGSTNHVWAHVPELFNDLTISQMDPPHIQTVEMTQINGPSNPFN